MSTYLEKFKKTKEKPCRTCVNFDQWIKNVSDQKNEKANANRKECPLDSEQLGQYSWGFLHTMAAYYPEKPTSQDQKDMKDFIRLFSKFYPCKPCAEHLQESLELPELTPKTTSNHELSQWFCKLHNHINKYLGKPEFDCGKVDQRWFSGWDDGSCG